MPFKPNYIIPPSMVEGAPNLGEGVSRALPGERTKLFTVLVANKAERPMKATVRAANARKAKLYAGNRWPTATITVLP
jgi:hypothetical protein